MCVSKLIGNLSAYFTCNSYKWAKFIWCLCNMTSFPPTSWRDYSLRLYVRCKIISGALLNYSDPFVTCALLIPLITYGTCRTCSAIMNAAVRSSWSCCGNCNIADTSHSRCNLRIEKFVGNLPGAPRSILPSFGFVFCIYVAGMYATQTSWGLNSKPWDIKVVISHKWRTCNMMD